MQSHSLRHRTHQRRRHPIGLGGDLGSIEDGKLADNLLSDYSPLDDLGDTIAIREVWPRLEALPSQVWQDMEPDG
jgi:hypothetical protein